MKYEIKKDKYTENRGGDSRLINVFCKKCKKDILLYQKDGASGGWLKRMYLDRILAPEELTKEFSKVKSLDKLEPLMCPDCKQVLAVPMQYIKPRLNEDRMALKCISIGRDTNKKGIYPVKRRRNKTNKEDT